MAARKRAGDKNEKKSVPEKGFEWGKVDEGRVGGGEPVAGHQGRQRWRMTAGSGREKTKVDYERVLYRSAWGHVRGWKMWESVSEWWSEVGEAAAGNRCQRQWLE